METMICKECNRELPVESFKLSRWGERVHVCTECANKKRSANRLMKKQKAEQDKVKAETLAKDRRRILEGFTPRELMAELACRGYKGKLSYTNVIDICNM